MAQRKPLSIKSTSFPPLMQFVMQTRQYQLAEQVEMALSACATGYPDLNVVEPITKQTLLIATAIYDPVATLWLLKEAQAKNVELNIKAKDKADKDALTHLVSYREIYTTLEEKTLEVAVDAKADNLLDRDLYRRKATQELFALVNKDKNRLPMLRAALHAAAQHGNGFFVNLALNLPEMQEVFCDNEFLKTLLQNSSEEHQDLLINVFQQFADKKLLEKNFSDSHDRDIGILNFIAHAYGAKRWTGKGLKQFVAKLTALGNIYQSPHDYVPAVARRGAEAIHDWADAIGQPGDTYFIDASPNPSLTAWAIYPFTPLMVAVLYGHAFDEKTATRYSKDQLEALRAIKRCPTSADCACPPCQKTYQLRSNQLSAKYKYSLIDVAEQCGDIITFKTLLKRNLSIPSRTKTKQLSTIIKSAEPQLTAAHTRIRALWEAHSAIYTKKADKILNLLLAIKHQEDINFLEDLFKNDTFWQKKYAEFLNAKKLQEDLPANPSYEDREMVRLVSSAADVKSAVNQPVAPVSTAINTRLIKEMTALAEQTQAETKRVLLTYLQQQPSQQLEEVKTMPPVKAANEQKAATTPGLIKTVMETKDLPADQIKVALDKAYQTHSDLNVCDSSGVSLLVRAIETNLTAALWVLDKSASLSWYNTKLDIDTTSRQGINPLSILLHCKGRSEEEHDLKIKIVNAIFLLIQKNRGSIWRAHLFAALINAISTGHDFFVTLVCKQDKLLSEDNFLAAASKAMSCKRVDLADMCIARTVKLSPTERMLSLIMGSHEEQKAELIERLSAIPREKLQQTVIRPGAQAAVSLLYGVLYAHSEGNWTYKGAKEFMTTLMVAYNIPMIKGNKEIALSSVESAELVAEFGSLNDYVSEIKLLLGYSYYQTEIHANCPITFPMTLVAKGFPLEAEMLTWLRNTCKFDPNKRVTLAYKGYNSYVVNCNLLKIAKAVGDLQTTKLLLSSGYHDIPTADWQIKPETFTCYNQAASLRISNLIDAHNYMICGDRVKLLHRLHQMKQYPEDIEFLASLAEKNLEHKKFLEDVRTSMHSGSDEKAIVRAPGANGLFAAPTSEQDILDKMIGLAKRLSNRPMQNRFIAFLQRIKANLGKSVQVGVAPTPSASNSM